MANKIGGVVTKFAKTERQLIIAIMLIIGIMSGFLSNTGTAASLILVAIGIATRSGFARSRLLMPLVFAAVMGGNLSLVGAPGNLIAQDVLENVTGIKFVFLNLLKSDYRFCLSVLSTLFLSVTNFYLTQKISVCQIQFIRIINMITIIYHYGNSGCLWLF